MLDTTIMLDKLKLELKYSTDNEELKNDDDYLLLQLNKAYNKVALKRNVSIDKLENTYEHNIVEIALYNILFNTEKFMPNVRSENEILGEVIPLIKVVI